MPYTLKFTDNIPSDSLPHILDDRRDHFNFAKIFSIQGKIGIAKKIGECKKRGRITDKNPRHNYIIYSYMGLYYSESLNRYYEVVKDRWVKNDSPEEFAKRTRINGICFISNFDAYEKKSYGRPEEIIKMNHYLSEIYDKHKAKISVKIEKKEMALKKKTGKRKKKKSKSGEGDE